MNKTALIFGAGKTGRGFAAHLAFIGGYEIVLIDKNRQLVSDLKKTNQYDIEILDNKEKMVTFILVRELPLIHRLLARIIKSLAG